ncbi:MAG: formylglycine-generating enzyme family protein [Synechococcus sp.]
MAELILQRRQETARYFPEALGTDIELDMIWVSGGSFEMGSPDSEPERYNDEGPQHPVTVPNFFMGRYPITQDQWRFVAEQIEQVNRSLEPDPAVFKGEKHPVESISWFEAVEFCDRLSQHTKRTYRLPSEAEWEYACRAGTKTPFYFGDILTAEVANFDSSVSYNGSPIADSRRKTTPVDLYGIANAFGLCDMHGNVREWCLDHWHDSYEGAPNDGSAWIDGNDDENQSRVWRGGSWANPPRDCRSAYRFYYPRGSDHGIGFRVVCEEPRSLQ